ncbi:MAG: RDD family protein [Gammaproteobacteria bacterium]|nr:RDD family protein [Gammaproteobacteria bacterium]
MLKSRTDNGSVARRSLLIPLRICAAITVFGLATALLQPLWERYAPQEESAAKEHGKKVSTWDDLGLEGVEVLVFAEQAIELQTCDDGICRIEKMESLTRLLGKSTKPMPEKRKVLVELARDAAADTAEQVALTKVIDKHLPESAPKSEAGNAEPAPEEAPEIQALRAALQAEETDNQRLNAEVAKLREAAEGFSLMKTLQNLAQDLGFGVGWAAVYFTIFTSWWNGQTPGKRFLGIRVVHLNSKPLSLWETFSRFGGYSAGFATGMLGFLQCLWDANRQAIHDKIVFTAVIRDEDGKILERAYAKQGDAQFGDFLDKLEDQEKPEAQPPAVS